MLCKRVAHNPPRRTSHPHLHPILQEDAFLSFFKDYFSFLLLLVLFFGSAGSSLLCMSFLLLQRVRGLLFIAVRGLLVAVALLWNTGSRHMGVSNCVDSVVAAHGLGCSMACEIFLDQGLNPCPLPWQAYSYPLYHQGSPVFFLLIGV